MRNHYIVRYELEAHSTGQRTMCITIPVDSNTTADDVQAYLVRAVQDREGVLRSWKVRFYMISLVHQVQ